MADFVEGEEEEQQIQEENDPHEKGEPQVEQKASHLIDINNPVRVLYCAVCSMPPEFCEFGSCFDKCLPWILENAPEVLSEEILAQSLGKASISEEGVAQAEGDEAEEKKKKKKGGGAAPPKKASNVEKKIVISKIQRQKKKYVTVVTGLETIPDLKVKDAARIFGKKFSSGSSVNDLPTGGKEVVIQGDVMLELPNVIITEFKVNASAISFLENGTLSPYSG